MSILSQFQKTKLEAACNLVDFLRARLLDWQILPTRNVLSRLALAARVQLQQLGLLLPNPRQFDYRVVASNSHSRTRVIRDDSKRFVVEAFGSTFWNANRCVVVFVKERETHSSTAPFVRCVIRLGNLYFTYFYERRMRNA